MSVDADLKRFIRDQKRQLFDELEEMQRRERWAIDAEQRADAFAQRRRQEERVDKLTPQIFELGRLAGMSDLSACVWAFDLVRDAKQRLM